MSDDENTPAEEAEIDDEAPSAETDDAAADVSGAAAPWAERYGSRVDPDSADVVLHADVEGYLATADEAKVDGFDQLVDLTAVDYLTFSAPRNLPEGVDAQRFEVVTSLINHGTGERVRIRVQVPADAPSVASLFDLWPGSESLEREVFDMFGIDFADHPDMSRVLMPDDWVGHPLRKDYAVGSIPVQFKSASNVR